LIAALWTNNWPHDRATLDQAAKRSTLSTEIHVANAAPMIASNFLIRTDHFNSLPPDRRNAPSKICGELIAPCFSRLLNAERQARSGTRRCESAS
jgi:hypothetical protein